MRRESRNHAPVEQDLALGRFEEPAQHIEERSFACAVRADHAMDYALVDAEVHPVERPEASELSGQAAHF